MTKTILKKIKILEQQVSFFFLNLSWFFHQTSICRILHNRYSPSSVLANQSLLADEKCITTSVALSAQTLFELVWQGPKCKMLSPYM